MFVSRFKVCYKLENKLMQYRNKKKPSSAIKSVITIGCRWNGAWYHIWSGRVYLWAYHRQSFTRFLQIPLAHWLILDWDFSALPLPGFTLSETKHNPTRMRGQMRWWPTRNDAFRTLDHDMGCGSLSFSSARAHIAKIIKNCYFFVRLTCMCIMVHSTRLSWLCCLRCTCVPILHFRPEK